MLLIIHYFLHIVSDVSAHKFRLTSRLNILKIVGISLINNIKRGPRTYPCGTP